VRHTGDTHYQDSWVAEVALATKNGGLILRYKALSSLFQRIRAARAAVRKYNAGSEYADERKKAAALKRLEAAEGRLRQLDQRYAASYNPDVVGAFVCFNSEESARRCVEDYSGSDSWANVKFWCQPDPLRFLGTHKLSVGKAPDPSTVVWENIEVTCGARLGRQIGVGFALVVLLTLCFFAVMLAQGFQQKFRSNVPNLTFCSDVLPAIAFGVPLASSGTPLSSLPAGLSFTRNTNASVCSAALGASASSTAVQYALQWTAVNSTTGEAMSSQASLVNDNACLQQCTGAEPSGQCVWPTSSGGSNITFSLSTNVACYCLQRLRSSMGSGASIFAAAADIITQDAYFCSSAAWDYIASSVLLVLASLVVVAINFLLPQVIAHMTALERHRSVEARDWSLAIKIFVALFLNTAVLVLLTNAAMPAAVHDIAVGESQLFSGSYDSFDTRWHAAVGSGVVLTMLLNIVSPHMVAFCYALVWPCKTRLLCCGASARSHATQTELNAAWEPPPFLFPWRVASIGNSVAVCLFYCGGHPLLLSIAFASLVASYLVDRYMLLRVYRMPPRYNVSMAELLLRLLPW
jgi:hypothetical protein